MGRKVEIAGLGLRTAPDREAKVSLQNLNKCATYTPFFSKAKRCRYCGSLALAVPAPVRRTAFHTWIANFVQVVLR